MDNVLSSAQCFTGGHSRSFFGYLNGIFCHGENNRFPWEISSNLNIISWKLVHQSEDIYIYIWYIYIWYIYICMYVCIINPISYATEVNQLNQGFVAPTLYKCLFVSDLIGYCEGALECILVGKLKTNELFCPRSDWFCWCFTIFLSSVNVVEYVSSYFTEKWLVFFVLWIQTWPKEATQELRPTPLQLFPCVTAQHFSMCKPWQTYSYIE